jgi:hypothetical protein
MDVTKRAYARSRDVNEAVAERMPVAAGARSESFAALYERTFPRVYAYVASLLRVVSVTNRHGGFVLSSSVDTGQEGAGGDFSLRIPADRLRPALRDLARLAPVVRQTQEGRDVTRRYVTRQDRLRAARG